MSKAKPRNPNCVMVSIPTSELLEWKDILNLKVSKPLERVLDTAHEMGAIGVEMKDNSTMVNFDDPYKAIDFYNEMQKRYIHTRISNRVCDHLNNIKGHDA